ncbi:hypothetical protein AVEN_163968-1 [Araneus ventricosus]|uniref:Uncharacterized protein n=1 Tax=Araneus ventricosus TaxID=182803 RepID=A0A4Y2LY99_ARAVE|nr:hypothetical protein AVEN_263406-1 [Araneus ventricosus]GBN19140.1 hypothetical protein AVEN_163968-1 [Araneus ventricosus]
MSQVRVPILVTVQGIYVSMVYAKLSWPSFGHSQASTPRKWYGVEAKSSVNVVTRHNWCGVKSSPSNIQLFPIFFSPLHFEWILPVRECRNPVGCRWERLEVEKVFHVSASREAEMGRVQWFVHLLWRSDVIGFRRERFQKTPKSSRQDWKRTKSSYSTVDMSLVEVEVNNECSCANDKMENDDYTHHAAFSEKQYR